MWHGIRAWELRRVGGFHFWLREPFSSNSYFPSLSSLLLSRGWRISLSLFVLLPLSLSLYLSLSHQIMTHECFRPFSWWSLSRSISMGMPKVFIFKDCIVSEFPHWFVCILVVFISRIFSFGVSKSCDCMINGSVRRFTINNLRLCYMHHLDLEICLWFNRLWSQFVFYIFPFETWCTMV